MKDFANLANPDPVKRSIQCIQRIEQSFRLGLPPVSPEVFRHSIEGLNGFFNVCRGC